MFTTKKDIKLLNAVEHALGVGDGLQVTHQDVFLAALQLLNNTVKRCNRDGAQQFIVNLLEGI